MKLQFIPIVLSLIASAALAYLAHYISQGEAGCTAATIGTGVCAAFTLATTFGVKVDSTRVSFNLKTWSFTAFVVFLIINLLFAWLGADSPLYIIAITLLLTIHLAMIYKILTTNNI